MNNTRSSGAQPRWSGHCIVQDDLSAPTGVRMLTESVKLGSPDTQSNLLLLLQVTKVKLAQKQKEGIAEARSGRRQPVSAFPDQLMPSPNPAVALYSQA